MSKENILISLEPRHAESILSGEKKFELRRRAIRVDPGAIVWMYSKLPQGSIVGYAIVASVHTGAPSSLWRRYGKRTGISRQEFFTYFSESTNGFALELQQSTRLANPISLGSLRQADSKFQPPQFFKRLNANEQVFKAIKREGKEAKG